MNFKHQLNRLLFQIDKLLKRPNIKNGFISVSKSKRKKDGDFELGRVVKKGLKKDKDWRGFEPVGEQQNIGYEKMWCVSESACNAIETIINYYIQLVNNEEADEDIQEIVKVFKYFGLVIEDKCLLNTHYVAAGSGTSPRGNNQKRVADFIRHYGLIPKAEWPDGHTWNDHYFQKDGVYINGNRVPQKYLDKGQKLAEFIEISYEWVEPHEFGDANQDGAIQTSGYAWPGTYNGVYPYVSYAPNHAFQESYAAQSAPKYYFAFDSYNPFQKKLAPNYNLGSGMLYSFQVKKKFTIFNREKISQVKKKWDYILLVNTCKDFTPGVYKIGDGILEKKEANEMATEAVKQLKADGKLEGVSAEFFATLLN
jgi:hypothetical protein